MLFENKGGYQLLYVFSSENNEAEAVEYLNTHQDDTPWEHFSVLTKTFKGHAFDLSPRGRWRSNLNALVRQDYICLFENEFDMQKASNFINEHRDEYVFESLKEMFPGAFIERMEKMNG